jgi:hypothetical protein
MHRDMLRNLRKCSGFSWHREGTFWFPGDLISVSVRHGLRFASVPRQGFHANIAIDYLPDSADGKEEPVCQSFQDGRSNSSETALQLISAHRVARV